MFAYRHIPPLFVAAATTFGGLWPFWDPKAAMLEFGLPLRLANVRETHPLMVLCSGRTTALGLALFVFYLQGKLAEMDTVLSVLGLWVGLVDFIVCWQEQVRGKAVFRLTSGLVIGGWGLLGMTQGSR